MLPEERLPRGQHSWNYGELYSLQCFKAAISESVYLFQQGPVEFREDGARPDNVMRLRQNRVEQQGGMYVSCSFVLFDCMCVICIIY